MRFVRGKLTKKRWWGNKQTRHTSVKRSVRVTRAKDAPRPGDVTGSVIEKQGDDLSGTRLVEVGFVQ